MLLETNSKFFTFRSTYKIMRALEEAGIYFRFKIGEFPPEGSTLGGLRTASSEPFVIFRGSQWIGRFGFLSYTNSPIDLDVEVGRYCSIAGGLRIMGDSHPTDKLTTHTIAYQKSANIHLEPSKRLGGSDFRPISMAQRPMPVIEHDVWIGQDVTLARGITLGTGSVVAACSVVTKSVPPYAIVGGNPAKTIRYRFPEAVIMELLRVRWWRFAYTHFSEMNFENPELFLVQLEAKEKVGLIAEYQPEKVDAYNIVLENCERAF